MTPDTELETEAIVVDGSVMLNSLSSSTSTDFDEYARVTISFHMCKYSPTSTREQVLSLTSIYHPAWSLKQGRNEEPEQGDRWQELTRLKKTWRTSFGILRTRQDSSISLWTESLTWIQLILSSWLRKIWFSVIRLDNISPCSHEEADTGMFVHARHTVQEGYKVHYD